MLSPLDWCTSCPCLHNTEDNPDYWCYIPDYGSLKWVWWEELWVSQDHVVVGAVVVGAGDGAQ